MSAEVRTATGATIQLRYDDGTVIDLELAPDALQKLTADVAMEADIRDLPTNGPFLEREATGRRTAHLVLDGPIVPGLAESKVDLRWEGNAMDQHIEATGHVVGFRRYGREIRFAVTPGPVTHFDADQAEFIARQLFAASVAARQAAES